MFIDTHMHISEEFGVKPDLFVKNAIDNNVKIMIASFCEKDDLELSTFYVEKYKNIYAAIGYHPEVTNNIVDKDIKILEDKIKSNKKIVAVGEIGLDYYWDKNNKDEQKELFRRQLMLAQKLNLPVVIHSRDSIADTYDILSEFKVQGVIHCFSGSVEMAKRFINLGFLLGIGGVVTFKNSNLYKVIEQIPLESIVLETDSPYLTPEPNRGKTNESSNIPYIAKKIADIKNIDISQVETITTNNAFRIFDLKY